MVCHSQDGGLVGAIRTFSKTATPVSYDSASNQRDGGGLVAGQLQYSLAVDMNDMNDMDDLQLILPPKHRKSLNMSFGSIETIH